MERTCREACNISPAGLMTPRDAAVYIGVKINTLAVWRMTNRYGLRYLKLGKAIRYRKDDLDEWLASKAVDKGVIQEGRSPFGKGAKILR